MSIQGALAASLRRFDPSPGAILDLRFKGDRETGYRPFFKREGIIYPTLQQVRGFSSPGGAGFAKALINEAYRDVSADNPPIGDDGLAIWEARTNDAVNPQNFIVGNSYSLEDVTTGPILTPGGAITFGEVTESAAAAVVHRIRAPLIAVTAALTRTISFRVKGGRGRSYFAIRTNLQDISVGYSSSVFNLDTGQVSTTGTGHIARITPDAAGYFRCSIQLTPANSGVGSVYFGFPPTDSGAPGTLGAQSWDGDPSKGGCVWAYNNEAGVDIAGAPIVQTSGLAATRTAVAPQLNLAGAALAAPSILYVDADLPAGDGVHRTLTGVSDGSFANRIGINRTTTGVLELNIVTGGSTQTSGSMSGSFTGARRIKAAVRIRPNGKVLLAADGALAVGGEQTVALPAGQSILTIGNGWLGATRYLNGFVRRVAILPDMGEAQLQALTA